MDFKKTALEYSDGFELWLGSQPLKFKIEELLVNVESIIDCYNEGSLEKFQIDLLNDSYVNLINYEKGFDYGFNSYS